MQLSQRWMLCAALLSALSAEASVVLSGTRVILPEADGEAVVRMENKGERPGLIQAWLDLGDSKTAPEPLKLPFVLTPPMFRLDPNKGQSLRVLYTKAALPQDRESLFWLNVLEIPPKAEHAAGANQLQVAVRTRIKLFFRPKGLVGTPMEAAEQLKWSLIKQPQGYALQVSNPNPFHVSLTDVELDVGVQHYSAQFKMLKPLANEVLPLQGFNRRPDGVLTVSYRYINDYGAAVPLQQALPRD